MASDLLIVGGEGDLALRKLYPALYSLSVRNCLPADFRVFGMARRESTQEAFLAEVKERFTSRGKAMPFEEKAWLDFTSHLTYCASDATSPEALGAFRDTYLTDSDRDLIVYLATPPSIFGSICQALDHAGLVSAKTRIVVEKPLGEDRESYLEINRQLTAIFEEEQVYRIDHYLGKEPVQNLLALRFANTFLEPLWNKNYIDNVQITVAESIGVSGRWDFYDGAGAMRDMVQNHLLQLLCLLAMEPPAQLEATAVRNEKLKVLSCLRPMSEEDVGRSVVIGQYSAGAIDGQPVPGYCEEEGAESTSDTETYVALTAHIDNWRWAGVPFYLRTGKRLNSRLSEIVVEFKQVPHSIFPDQQGSEPPNRMVIRLQPEESISLELMHKVAGLDVSTPLRRLQLDLSFPEEAGASLDAYQRLLLDVIRQNPTLFVRTDEVEAAWSWVDHIQDVWAKKGKQPEAYTAGSSGPANAIAMISRDNRRWHKS
jgi:glucose-6-phosphate 1-dehydrogenase